MIRRRIMIHIIAAAILAIGIATAVPADGMASERRFRGGRVHYEEGVPFLELRGPYYEMGLQYGVLMRTELRRSMANIYRYRKAFLSSLPWYVRPISGPWIAANVVIMEERLPPQYREELAGMADGSGLDYRDLVFYSFAPEFFMMGCSSVVTRSGGSIILGRNLDFDPPSLGRFPIVIEYNAPESHKVTSVGFIGFAGILTGMNDQGLALSVNASFRYQAGNSRDIPVGHQLRRILECAGTIAGVDDFLKRYTCNLGWTITVASVNDGQGAVFDLTGHRTIRNDMGEKRHIFVTNAFLSEEARHRYMSSLMATHPFIQSRFDAIACRLAQRPVEALDGMIDLLADTSICGTDVGLNGSMMTVNNIGTLQTVVMDPKAGWLCFSSAPGFSGFGRFLGYDLETGAVTIHREAVRSMMDERSALAEWRESTSLFFVERDFRGLFTTIDLASSDYGVHPAIAAFQIWEKRPGAVDPGALLQAIDRAAGQYPDLAVFPVIRGQVLSAMGRFEDAAGVLEGALALNGNYPSTRMMAHRMLAEAYFRLRLPARAAEHARRCIEIVRDYAVGKGERQLVLELEKIITAPTRKAIRARVPRILRE